MNGAWYHVYHRDIAKRQVFVVDADYQSFLALLALAVRRGEVELHGYCLMQNHFHLLVKSLGGVSTAMKRVLEAYTMRFNRRYDRDGALFAGRYRAKLVGTLLYRGLLLRYIDHNPVEAGVVPRPERYRFGSAADILHGLSRPWLCTSWTREEVRLRLGGDVSFQRGYRTLFCRLHGDERTLVEARIARSAADAQSDELQKFVELDEAAILEWFREQAMRADGRVTSLPLSTPDVVLRILRRNEGLRELGTSLAPRKLRDPSALADVARCALLRELCRLGFAQIGLRLGVSERVARRYYGHHRLLLSEGCYARVIATCAAQCTSGLAVSSRSSRSEKGQTTF